jgi:mRNA interferase MazF
MTTKTAISLPDDLFREIERARKRSKKDRSTWIQEAASEYLRKRTKEEEVEAWLSAEERVPLTEDELSFMRWNAKHFGEMLGEAKVRPKRKPREMARATEHGEVWQARVDKVRPVVIVSRDDVSGRRTSATVASVTTNIRGVPSQVVVDERDGLRELSAINCDELSTIKKDHLIRRIGRLSETTVDALDDALRFALQLR